MNAMPKASTYKRVRSTSADKPATSGSPTRAGKKGACAKESPARHDQRLLAEMQVQLRQINATLDEVEQSMRERGAW
jgi:hypothetical protein